MSQNPTTLMMSLTKNLKLKTKKIFFSGTYKTLLSIWTAL